MDMNSINGILRAVATARPQLAKADTAFQGAFVGQPTEPCLEGNDLFDALALDVPVLDQGRRPCFDGWPMRQQQCQWPFSEALRAVAAARQLAQIIQHGCRLL